MKKVIDINIKRTYTVEEIQAILNIGRNSAYNLVKSGVFRSVNIGSIIRISKVSFDSWLVAKLEGENHE